MLWVKAFHIIFVVTWFAGLFYLPRLFIYHTEATDQISIDRFKLMEKRLIKVIMTPSAVLALLFGTALLVNGWPAYKSSGWLWVKLALVAGLLTHHIYALSIAKRLAANEPSHSSRFLRIYNEVPALILIAVVVLAVVRPF